MTHHSVPPASAPLLKAALLAAGAALLLTPLEGCGKAKAANGLIDTTLDPKAPPKLVGVAHAAAPTAAPAFAPAPPVLAYGPPVFHRRHFVRPPIEAAPVFSEAYVAPGDYAERRYGGEARFAGEQGLAPGEERPAALGRGGGYGGSFNGGAARYGAGGASGYGQGSAGQPGYNGQTGFHGGARYGRGGYGQGGYAGNPRTGPGNAAFGGYHYQGATTGRTFGGTGYVQHQSGGYHSPHW